MARVAPTENNLVDLLCATVVGLCRQEQTDLSARQLGVLLTCYLTDEPQTVRGLAAALNVSKPAITRALDRLGEFDFLRRKVDPKDRRSVFAVRTIAGAKYLRTLEGIMREAAGAAQRGAARAG